MESNHTYVENWYRADVALNSVQERKNIHKMVIGKIIFHVSLNHSQNIHFLMNWRVLKGREENIKECIGKGKSKDQLETGRRY